MVIDVPWQEREELLAQRVEDARWDGRHERSTSHGALAPSRAWPSCLPSPLSHAERDDHAYWRGRLTEALLTQALLAPAGLVDAVPAHPVLVEVVLVDFDPLAAHL